MKYKITVLAILAAAGCERADGKGSEPHKSDNAITTPAPADNTKNNERDRNTATLTPGDQGENDSDRTITQRIRQSVVKDDAISFSGKNVKIITINGVVTLRGPVDTAKEKEEIATIAQRVDGVKRIDNQIEIAAK
ncbi:BON domain-containing protein [Pendulispora albinea]|uniref:BON domain-containing protein n=1 Tax=Pendulispora albinea TaxID=2741071 RepID=A0ABZ2M9Y5_9BACT